MKNCPMFSMHMRLLRVSILISLIISFFDALPVQAATAVLSDNYNPSTDGPVWAMALQPDGKLLVAGEFRIVNNIYRWMIARLNPDGSLDTSFNPAEPTVYLGATYALALQPDGKILIGGDFSNINKTSRNGIARLNADGSLDTTFDPGTGANDCVYSLAVQSDGKIMVGGAFSRIDGKSRSGIARLNANGSVDTVFDSGSGADNEVFAIALQSYGRTLIGGRFSSIDGKKSNFIARLNAKGSLDIGFKPAINNYVNAFVIQPDGKILLGGAFTMVGGEMNNHIARLNSNGSLDSAFQTALGADDEISAIAAQPDGKIIIGGAFTHINGVECRNIARLNPNGTLDVSYNTVGGVDGDILALVLQSDGKSIIGGDFLTVNGTPRNYAARLLANGSLDAPFNQPKGPNQMVLSVLHLADSGMIASGWFTAWGETPAGHIARLKADGSLDPAFNIGTGANGPVCAVAIQAEGKILMSGYFSNINGYSQHGIARLNPDGTVDSTFAAGYGANGGVTCMTQQPDGKILIAGNFTSFNGIGRACIARLNPNGSLDTTFDPRSGANNIIYSIALQPDGKIVIVGDFTAYGGTWRTRVARLTSDGSLDSSFDPGTGAGSTALAVAIDDEGKILIGGTFTTFNGMARKYLTRLNDNGSLDDTFACNLFGTIRAILLQGDGRIFVGGSGVIRLENSGTRDSTFDPGSGPNGSVYALAFESNTRLLVGGIFTNVNNIPCQGLTRLNMDGSFDPSCNSGTGASSIVYAIAIQRDGKSLLGGDFLNINGVKCNRIARLNQDGSVDGAFDTGAGMDGSIEAITLQPDGKMLVGGTFKHVDGTTQTCIARLNSDGSLDKSFDKAPSMAALIRAVLVQPDGKILIGGLGIFSAAYPNLARLNADGSLDTSFVPGALYDAVYSLALQPDGKILKGLCILSGGYGRSHITRVNADGSADPTFVPGSGPNEIVSCIALQPDGKILIGGDFTSISSSVRQHIARLNSDGSLDNTFDTGVGANTMVESVILQAGGKIWIGGAFTQVSGVALAGLARLNANGSLDATFAPGPGFDAQVFCLAAQLDGQVLVGGNFTKFNDMPQNYYARVPATGAAGQVLAISTEETSVSWILSGASPWFNKVFFEGSSNGIDWQPLGWGVSAGDAAYQLDNLNLPTDRNYYLRGTGWSPSGQGNGSTSLQQSVICHYGSPGSDAKAIGWDLYE